MKATSVNTIIEKINSIAAAFAFEDGNCIRVNYRAKKNDYILINTESGEVIVKGNVNIYSTVEAIVNEVLTAENIAESVIEVKAEVIETPDMNIIEKSEKELNITITDNYNVLGAKKDMVIETFEITFDKVINGVRIIKIRFSLKTDHPMHKGYRTLVIDNTEGGFDVYELN